MHPELVQIAQREVGVREEGGANCGPRIREYQAATWLKPDPWPWCAAFTCWVLREWLLTPLGKAYLGVNRGVESWRCHDASAFGWLGWAKSRGLVVGDAPQAGDFVVYDFNGPKAGGGHIGIVSEVLADGRFRAIEGNTNDEGGREGIEVAVMTRTRSAVVGFVRLGSHAP